MNINCGGQVDMGSPWGGLKEDGIAFLVAAWNTRAEGAAHPQADVRELVEALAVLDAAEKTCPANNGRLGGKPCPKCGAGLGQNCGPSLMAMDRVVRSARQAAMAATYRAEASEWAAAALTKGADRVMMPMVSDEEVARCFPSLTRGVKGELDVIVTWYQSLPPRARQGLSLQNLHDLSKRLNAARSEGSRSTEKGG
jgi:hypothetical protein